RRYHPCAHRHTTAPHARPARPQPHTATALRWSGHYSSLVEIFPAHPHAPGPALAEHPAAPQTRSADSIGSQEPPYSPRLRQPPCEIRSAESAHRQSSTAAPDCTSENTHPSSAPAYRSSASDRSPAPPSYV